MNKIICSACHKPIEGKDYDDRHWGHEDGCPNKTKPNSVDCFCDLEYHADCCPDCKDSTDEDGDFYHEEDEEGFDEEGMFLYSLFVGREEEPL